MIRRFPPTPRIEALICVALKSIDDHWQELSEDARKSIKRDEHAIWFNRERLGGKLLHKIVMTIVDKEDRIAPNRQNEPAHQPKKRDTRTLA